MSAGARAARPPSAARRWAAAGRRARQQEGNVTLVVCGIMLAALALMVLFADFVSILAAYRVAQTAADAAARGALAAWQAAAAAPAATAPAPPSCRALAAFRDAYPEIAAAAAHYAAGNGARLDPARPPALLPWRRGFAVRVAVLQPLLLGRYQALLDPTHRLLRVSGVASWAALATAAAATDCAYLLP